MFLRGFSFWSPVTVGAMVLALCCCTLTPPPERSSGYQPSSKNIIIYTAPGKPTVLETEVVSDVLWVGIKRGALEGISSCSNIQVQGGEEALLQLLWCLPFGAVIGAIAGAAAAPEPLAVDLDKLEGFLGEQRAQLMLQAHSQDYIREMGLAASIIKSRAGETVSGASLEIWVKRIKLSAKSRESMPHLVPMRLIIDVHVRVIDRGRGKEVDHFNHRLRSPMRSYNAWLANDFAEVQTLVRDLARQVVDKSVERGAL